MDYAESLIYLKQYVKSIENQLNKRNFAMSYEIALEIEAEAKQLRETIQTILEVKEELK